MQEYQGNTTGSLGKLLDWIERDAAGNLSLAVEELRFVTTPSRAPLRWAEVTMTGRHRGLKVIGTGQRLAAIDKDFPGNAALIHTSRLVYLEDIRAVAKGHAGGRGRHRRAATAGLDLTRLLKNSSSPRRKPGSRILE